MRLCARAFLVAAILMGTLAGASEAPAQEITLRLHHFLPPVSTAHRNYFLPWAERVSEQSDGRIEVQVFPAMQLGGTPATLYDQVKRGVVDVAWFSTASIARRFPALEVFHLPFMSAVSCEATSKAAWEFYERNSRDRIDDIQVIMVQVHSPGLFHMKGVTINRLEDLRALTLGAYTRNMIRALELLDAEPVGMSGIQSAQAISRNVIDGTLLPWEAARSLRIIELADSHTEFAGQRGLYTTTFIVAMNKRAYESLPDDLKQVIDDNSGIEEAALMGRLVDEWRAPAPQMALDRGNTIVRLDAQEQQRWAERLQPVIDEWIARVDALGLDGEALLQEARELVAKHVGETQAR